jgi:eukaryotic-like serine/threonine-protein kinase
MVLDMQRRTKQRRTSTTHARAGRADRYVLEQRLGVGATASVWRARDRRSGNDVCVKQLHEHLAADGDARRQLQTEADSVARLRHPSVLPLLDVRLDESPPSLVFAHAPGETLAARLGRDVTLTPAETLRIAAQLADALAAAHAGGVVHCDVKPANILLADDGRARLLDFGISRAPTPGAGEDVATAAVAVGTLPYMAPEQLAGRPPSPASDVFSLGAVLYQMISSAVPFAGKTPIDIARAQRLPPAAIAGVDSRLSDVILAALSYEPDARPSAGEFARALAGLHTDIDSQPTVAVAPVVAPEPALTAHAWRRPTRVAVAGLIAIVALAVVSAFAFAPDWSSPDGEGNQAFAFEPDLSPPPTPSATPEAQVDDPPDEPVVSSGAAAERPTNSQPSDSQRDKPKASGKDKNEGKAKGKGKGKGQGRGNSGR